MLRLGPLKDKKLFPLVLLIFLLGCGYSNKVVLPYREAKTIAVPMFKNTIPPQNILSYVAGLETHLTQAVVNEIAKDGNLKVVDEKNADLILRGEIHAYEKEGFRFNRFEQVDEFRLFIVVRLILEDRRTGKRLWTEKNFSGDTQFFINGPRAIPEEQAAQKAVTDLAEKIVNRVVEDW